MSEENKRRMFIGSKGQSSAVLRSKRDESEEDARKRLTESGWNMDAPHAFSKVTEGDHSGTGKFEVTDPKPPRKRKRKAKTPSEVKEDAPAEDSPVKTDDAKVETPEPATDDNKSGDSKKSDEKKTDAGDDASD